RIIEGALNIEFPYSLREDRIIRRINDTRILKEIDEAPLRDQIGDFRIASPRHDLWMLAQFADTPARHKFLRTFRAGKNAPCFLQRFICSVRNRVSGLEHAS